MSNFKIIKKAYKIDFDRIEEGYLASEQIVHAKNRNEAKSLLLNEIECDDWKIKHTNDSVEYLNIPVLRAKGRDIVMFEGKEVNRYQIEEIIAEKERLDKLDKILNDDGIEYCYIIKNGSYYRPNSSGYTGFQTRAGVYKKEEAVQDAKSCSELWIKAINIPEHNLMLNKEINELKERLI